MKNEFLALSPAGVVALFIAGALAVVAVEHHDLLAAGICLLCVAAVRDDGRSGFEAGSYKRGWFLWHRIGPVAESSTTNVVPFKGPAA